MSSGLDAIPNIDHCQQLVLSYAILNHVVLHSALQFPSEEEPKKVEEALMDPNWVIAKQDELNRIEM